MNGRNTHKTRANGQTSYTVMDLSYQRFKSKYDGSEQLYLTLPRSLEHATVLSTSRTKMEQVQMYLISMMI